MAFLFSYKKYRFPMRVPLRTAHGVWSEREGIIVRLEDETGTVGFGEIAPIAWFGGETLAEAEGVCADLGDKPDAARLDAVPERFSSVRFALAEARDIATVAKSDRRLPVAALLPAGVAALEVLAQKLEAGFLAFKWKVGVQRPEEELGLLDDLLGRMPAYTRLRVDANGAWDRRQAETWLARCAERPIEFVEQPVAADKVDLLLGLAHDYPVTQALDESVSSLAAAHEWQSRGWPGVFVIKPALAGPLPEIARWMARTRPEVVFSSAIETALARASILRFVLAHDLTKRALGFGVGEVFGDRRWDGPVVGPLLDTGWCDAVHGEELWNALS